MRILFSEANADYDNYVFPYAIWAIPEPDEAPSYLFNRGFLPSSKQLDRFYLCRQVRVNLKEFSPSSENRRIFRKCEKIKFKLMPRAQFNFDDNWREFCMNYADIRFGKGVMTQDRMDGLFKSRIVNHVLLFTDSDTGKDVGIATLFLEEEKMVYYYYAFYDLNYYPRNLGMFMMSASVDYFARHGFSQIYLGSCYSRNALYKTQFSGAEFFNGFRWSDDIRELKFLIRRDSSPSGKHLLEESDYLREFCQDNLDSIIRYNGFHLKRDE